MGQNKRDRTLNWNKSKYYADTAALCKDLLKKRTASQQENTKSTKAGEADGKKA